MILFIEGFSLFKTNEYSNVLSQTGYIFISNLENTQGMISRLRKEASLEVKLVGLVAKSPFTRLREAFEAAACWCRN